MNGGRAIELQAGHPSDLAIVAEMMAESFDPRFGEAWTTSQCLGMLALPGTWLTLARVDDRLVGFALARAIMDDAELLLLAVRPSVRKSGIGGALLRAIIAQAKDKHGKRLHLEVRDGNHAARLYRSHGFEKIGLRKDYYRGNGGEIFSAETYALPLTE